MIDARKILSEDSRIIDDFSILCEQIAFPEDNHRFSLKHLPEWCAYLFGQPKVEDLEYFMSAWHYLYNASHIFNNVEDQNDYHVTYNVSVPQTINIAGGMLTRAGLHLSKISDPSLAVTLADRMFDSISKMSAGQHVALGGYSTSFRESWELLALRSAAFFGAACWSGARLTTQDKKLLLAVEDYGFAIGILIQIANDQGGLWSTADMDSDIKSGLRRTLPIAYALEVLPHKKRKQLEKVLKLAQHNPIAEENAREIIVSSGALAYSQAHAEFFNHSAQNALSHISKHCEQVYYRNLLNVTDALNERCKTLRGDTP